MSGRPGWRGAEVPAGGGEGGVQVETFDYVVAGAGSAGCVLANRLSADPRRSVLVLEGGGRDDWIWFHIPVGYLFAIGNPRADWMFRTTAQEGLGGRALGYPRGKVIGGCSAINAMIYMRGQAADYDHWRQLGLRGWGWEDVLPHFLAHEDHADGPSAHHAAGGELRVEHPRVHWDVLDRVRDAAEAVGVAQGGGTSTPATKNGRILLLSKVKRQRRRPAEMDAPRRFS